MKEPSKPKCHKEPLKPGAICDFCEAVGEPVKTESLDKPKKKTKKT